MIKLRSYLFTLYLFSIPLLVFLTLSPTLVSRKWSRWSSKIWALWVLGGLRVICGVRHRVEGLEHLPDKPVLIACKHQSMWETVALLTIVPNATFVMKQELTRVPIYGWWTRAAGHIGVDRDAGASAMREMLRTAQARVAEGCRIVIFPQGTRVPPDGDAPYHPGVAGLYATLQTECVPAALNSGLYWRHPGLMRIPGEIVVRFLPPIPAGLDRKAFMSRLKTDIETATSSLVEQGRRVDAAVMPPAEKPESAETTA